MLGWRAAATPISNLHRAVTAASKEHHRLRNLSRDFLIPAHYCINPLDPYAEQEVLITYEDHRPLVVIE